MSPAGLWDVSVSELQVIPDPVLTLVPPETDRINVIDSNKFFLDFRDPLIGMGTQEGDGLVICSRDAGISGCDEKGISDVLCLLRSSSSGNAGHSQLYKCLFTEVIYFNLSSFHI